MSNMIADDRHGPTPVSDHAVFDRVAQVNDTHVGFDEARILKPGLPFVLLVDNLLVQNIELANHQETQILNDVGSQVCVRNCVAVNIKSKPLTLKPTPVGKLKCEIESDALVWHGISFY